MSTTPLRLVAIGDYVIEALRDGERVGVARQSAGSSQWYVRIQGREDVWWVADADNARLQLGILLDPMPATLADAAAEFADACDIVTVSRVHTVADHVRTRTSFLVTVVADDDRPHDERCTDCECCWRSSCDRRECQGGTCPCSEY